MLKLNYVCKNDWDMPVYKDQNGKLWLDVNLGKGQLDLCSSSNNEIDGEPCYSINTEYELVTKYEEDPNRFNYMMLARLRSDCDYYLGYGHRYKGIVSGKNGIDTIAEMKKLWNDLPSDGKPEWLSMKDIEEYEQEMITPSGKFSDPHSWGEYIRSKKKKDEERIQELFTLKYSK